MKRRQLYLDDDMWIALQIRARQYKTTISELIRQAVREKFLPGAKRKEAMPSAIGLRKDRTDLPETERYVRQLRKGSRLNRVARRAKS